MISVIITAFREPKTIGRAIKSITQQKIAEDYEIIVSAPDKETLDVAKKYSLKFKQVKLFQDAGKGKSSALNQILSLAKGRILVFTDGDVYVSANSLTRLVNAFNDEKVGCATGRPISREDRKTLLGYWSHMLCDAGAHKLRMKRAQAGNFLECSGYLWALRNGIIDQFPTDVAEDSIVPAMLWLKNYQVRYVPEAEVYVSYPKNLRDYIEQKRRTIKSHEKLNKYVKTFPKMKSFGNEVLGAAHLFTYASNTKEISYTLLAFPIRFFLWGIAYGQYFFKKEYSDVWKRVESTKEVSP